MYLRHTGEEGPRPWGGILGWDPRVGSWGGRLVWDNGVRP